MEILTVAAWLMYGLGMFYWATFQNGWRFHTGMIVGLISCITALIAVGGSLVVSATVFMVMTMVNLIAVSRGHHLFGVTGQVTLAGFALVIMIEPMTDLVFLIT